MRRKKTALWGKPSWLWHWHHLMSGFVFLFGVGMLVASVQYSAIRFPAQASAGENLMGWIWADPAGWISVNSDNPASCSPGPCGAYGVHLDQITRALNGFAWSDVAGWICFGSSCAATVACNGTPPSGALTASVDMGTGTMQAHGWAKVCNEGDNGWISLNCAEPGACAAVSPYYKVVFNPSTGYFADMSVPGTSFAWNGTSIGTGFGYLDFQRVFLRSEAGIQCVDGIDNDVDGAIDCADSGCSAEPSCAENLTNGNCQDGIDNDANGPMDCQEVACQAAPFCAETSANGAVCENGIDDDGDTFVDCMDSGCIGYPTCLVAGEAACGPGIDVCCSDTVDNDSSGLTDCEDPTCITAPMCTPAWLQAKFGNVYAQQGITGQIPAPGQTGSSGSYCLTTQGEIVGFSSESGCTETRSQSLALPKSSTGYEGTLGSLDIPGILSGRYGRVNSYTGSLPDILDGKVYHADADLVTLNATMFQNGNGATQRGNGLLIVEGDLFINGDLSYQTNVLSQYLRNLASFGVIVKQRSNGRGGNIYIQPGVREIVGAFFAEGAIRTGTSGAMDQPLRVLGLLAAHQLNFERQYKNQTTAAETVIFDGRAVANPPPGMQDISKSLPMSKDAY